MESKPEYEYLIIPSPIGEWYHGRFHPLEHTWINIDDKTVECTVCRQRIVKQLKQTTNE